MKNNRLILILLLLSLTFSINAQTNCNDEKYYGEIHCVQIYYKFCNETPQRVAQLQLRFVNNANSYRNVQSILPGQ